MADDNMQLTGDPERIAHVLAERDGLKDGPTAVVEMHSGLKYSGSVAGVQWKSQSGSGRQARVGVCIILDTGTGKFRLDAFDIKTWKATSTPSPYPVATVQPG